MDNFGIINGGSFSLDPGAAFGMVPKESWSRFVTLNARQRVPLIANIPCLRIRDKVFCVDSGVVNNMDQRLTEFFEAKKNPRMNEEYFNAMGKVPPKYVIYTHLHFDHCGAFGGTDSDIFSKSVSIIQKEERRSYRDRNELTRNSYPTISFRRGRHIFTEGSTKINSSIQVVATGGHTSGHQATIAEIGNRKILSLGDLAPSPFYLRPAHITAIDLFPLESLKWKKKLIHKAIEQKMLLTFTHDPDTSLAEISGTVEKPVVTKVDLT